MINNIMKLTCRSCKTEVDQILKYSTKCKECTAEDARWRHIKATYGISKEEYRALYENQKGRCAICGCENKTDSKGNNLSVDHWHSPIEDKRRGTNRKSDVRGLLCHDCNIALGAFRENIDILSNAIEYLKSHPRSI